MTLAADVDLPLRDFSDRPPCVAVARRVEVRFAAHYGLTSDIAPSPKSASIGSREPYSINSSARARLESPRSFQKRIEAMWKAAAAAESK